MREASKTTRQRIKDALRENPRTPSELAVDFDITPSTALSHVEHVAQSVEGTDETVLVAPPSCEECGFDAFDELLNRPTRCPSCKSESIAEPSITIE